MTATLSYRTAEYYRESGRLNLVRSFLSLALGGALLIALAWLYAYIDAYAKSLGIFKVALPFIYGLMCGGLIGLLVYVAHIRIRALRMLLIVGLSGASLYLAWGFWLYYLVLRSNAPGFHVTPRSFLFHPKFAWMLVRYMAASPNTARLSLSVVWIVEALIILACSFFLARAIISGPSFCESCGCWTRSGVRLVTLPLTDIPTLRSQLESGDFVTMISMSPARAADTIWLEAWTYSCKRCKAFHTLSVKSAKNVEPRFRPRRRIGSINHMVISTIDLEALNAIRAEHRRNREAAPLAQPLQDDQQPAAVEAADEGDPQDDPALEA